MYTMQELAQPRSLGEAYRLLTARKNNAILGGCAFLRLGSQAIGTAIDLGQCQLDYIEETPAEIRIGALTTFRALETSPVLQTYANGVVSRAVGNVLGVQFRHIVTIGASVFSRYGFSDLLPPLLALEAEVELYQAGRLTLEAFLHSPPARDILTQVILKQGTCRASYQHLRKSCCDFPLLNAAVSEREGAWRVAVGARPGPARLARQAAAVLAAGGASAAAVEEAAQTAAAELAFESNGSASAAYRETLCRTLVRRAILEVLRCK